MSDTLIHNQVKMPLVIGWDIGGAHLKAVLLDANGTCLQCIQVPCALWRGLDMLEHAITDVLNKFKLSPNALSHAVTMTGELVDLFPDRVTGVRDIAGYAVKMLGQNVVFYSVNPVFVKIDLVEEHAAKIASANWHASASLVASYVKDALLIDIGSTTSDIIPIQQGMVMTGGFSDAERMQQDTLVYTGVVRTPVMILAPKIGLSIDRKTIETNIAAEFFATMADVYRLTNELLSTKDMAETADGKGKSQLDSARRLARMVGCDVNDNPMQTWIQLAFTCKSLQLQQLKLAVKKHLKPAMPIIGAGAGDFLVKALAAELNCEYISASKLILDQAQVDVDTCFPAYAVARLALLNATIRE